MRVVSRGKVPDALLSKKPTAHCTNVGTHVQWRSKSDRLIKIKKSMSVSKVQQKSLLAVLSMSCFTTCPCPAHFQSVVSSASHVTTPPVIQRLLSFQVLTVTAVVHNHF